MFGLKKVVENLPYSYDQLTEYIEETSIRILFCDPNLRSGQQREALWNFLLGLVENINPLRYINLVSEMSRIFQTVSYFAG